MKPRVGSLALLLASALAARPSAAEGRHFAIDATRSSLTVRTARGGLFSFAGHDHLIAASAFQGEIVADTDSLERSTVALAIDAGSLRVRAEGEPPDDVQKIQARMSGPELLDVARFAEIVFRSRTVSGKPVGPAAFDLVVSGDLSLHGVTRPLTLQVHVEVSGDALTATGRAPLRQTAFGLTPVSVAGVVKVRDEVTVDYTFVGMVKP